MSLKLIQVQPHLFLCLCGRSLTENNLGEGRVYWASTSTSQSFIKPGREIKGRKLGALQGAQKKRMVEETRKSDRRIIGHSCYQGIMTKMIVGDYPEI